MLAYISVAILFLLVIALLILSWMLHKFTQRLNERNATLRKVLELAEKDTIIVKEDAECS